MSLLDRAKSFPRAAKAKARNRFGHQEIDLALAWASGEIQLQQVGRALRRPPQGAVLYIFLARALKQAMKRGRLTRTDNSVPPDSKDEKGGAK